MQAPPTPPNSNVGPGVAPSPPQAARPEAIDVVAVSRQARRLAQADAPPWLHQEVAKRMAERLDFIKLRPQQVLDTSAWLGASAEALKAVYPQAQLLWRHAEPDLARRSQAALARPWWALGRGAPARWVGDDPATAPLVWSNLELHARADLPACLADWAARTEVGGFVMFSCYGPDSFVELRSLFRAAGWGRPAPAWWDMHDIGDLLGRAGFADPVMDQERLRLTWSSADRLLADLRALGGNVAPDRFQGLRTPRWRAALVRQLETLRGPDGLIALSLELVFGHAFKAAPRPGAAGETRIGVDELRAQLRSPNKGRPTPGGES
ncbi:MAG: biotin synthase [Roseateles sp.]